MDEYKKTTARLGFVHDKTANYFGAGAETVKTGN
jgi:hypothetical protein